MAMPASTVVWDDSIDPYDIKDFKLDLSPMLEPGENIAAHTLVLLSESLLMGLVLGTGLYQKVLNGNILTLWFSIDPTMQDNPVFNNGVTLPMEISITSDSTPARKTQRTVAIKVVQK